METRQVLSKKENKTSRRRETEWECLPGRFRCRTQFEVIVKSTHIQKEVKDIKILQSPITQRNESQNGGENETFIHPESCAYEDQIAIQSQNPKRSYHSRNIYPRLKSPKREISRRNIEYLRQNADFDKYAPKTVTVFASPKCNIEREKISNRFGELKESCNNSSNSDYLNHEFSLPKVEKIFSNESKSNTRREKPKHYNSISYSNNANDSVQSGNSNHESETRNKDILLAENLNCSPINNQTKRMHNKCINCRSFEGQKNLDSYSGYNLSDKFDNEIKNSSFSEDASLEKKMSPYIQMSRNVNGSDLSGDYMCKGDFLRQENHCNCSQQSEDLDSTQANFKVCSASVSSKNFKTPYKKNDSEREVKNCILRGGGFTDIPGYDVKDTHNENQIDSYLKNTNGYFRSNDFKPSRDENIFFQNEADEKFGINQNSENFSSIQEGTVICEYDSKDVNQSFDFSRCFNGLFSNSLPIYHETSTHSKDVCELPILNRGSYNSSINAIDDTLPGIDSVSAVFRNHQNLNLKKPEKGLFSDETNFVSSHHNGTFTRRKIPFEMSLERRTFPSTSSDAELSWHKENGVKNGDEVKGSKENRQLLMHQTVSKNESTVTSRSDFDSSEQAQWKVSVNKLVEYFENLTSSSKNRNEKMEDKPLVQIHFVYEGENEVTNDQKIKEKEDNDQENEYQKNKQSESRKSQTDILTDVDNQGGNYKISDSKEDLTKISVNIVNNKKIIQPQISEDYRTKQAGSQNSLSVIEDILGEDRENAPIFELRDFENVKFDYKTAQFEPFEEPSPTEAVSNEHGNKFKETNTSFEFSKAKKLHSPRSASSKIELPISFEGESHNEVNDTTIFNSSELQKPFVLNTQSGVQQTEALNTPTSSSREEKVEMLSVPKGEVMVTKRTVSSRQRKIYLSHVPSEGIPLENPSEKHSKSSHIDTRKSVRDIENGRSSRRICFIIRRCTLVGFTFLVILLLLASEWIDLKPTR
ncbi:hypothetical protein NPIL_99951 [Nephila pilipes]|uniref:Uncharacterized protein n=1 Tax=Nephila pilipes TaxID=299642 RepID=A0A8X6NQX3_NEPPI|nr:hypothetical protein NPIL_99951 [Nephila pilipes]